jgi:hypothetical protein
MTARIMVVDRDAPHFRVHFAQSNILNIERARHHFLCILAGTGAREIPVPMPPNLNESSPLEIRSGFKRQTRSASENCSY